MLAFANP